MIDLLAASAADTSMRAVLLAAGVAVVLWVFRIRSSSTRHAAWTAVAAAMLLMPLLTRIAPPVHVAFPTTISNVARPAAQISEQLLSEASPAAGPVVAVPSASPVAAPAVAPITVAPRAATRRDLLPTLAGVYLLVVAALLIRFLFGAFHLIRIRRSSRPIADSSAAGDAMESGLVATPVTVGLFAPRVILPLTWRDWSPGTLAAVLAHERAHASRRDPLIALLAHLNRVVFWFHPLAWWLERKLATLAEHACDDAALRQVERRSYAETLLDIAAMVRRHNGRLAWPAVGVDGDGRLGQRIDRVLAGNVSRDPSRARQVLVAVSCVIGIVVVAACRQQQANVPPLREDPKLAALLNGNAARVAAYDAARNMTAGQAAELEKALEQNPEDEKARQTLLTYYAWTGRNTQPWNENVAARRRHALWLVEHRPESDLVRQVRVDRDSDPDGYAKLRSTWLTLSAARDASPALLGNAAWFFEQSDRPQAEQLLLRAEALDPDGPRPRIQDSVYSLSWMQRLAMVYVQAIRSSDPAAQAWGRAKLTASSNGRLLNEAGGFLFNRARNDEQRSYSRSLIERASRTDSASAERSRELLRQLDPRESIRFSLYTVPKGKRQEVLAAASPGEKLRLLSSLAELDYMSGEYADWAARQKSGHPAAPTDPKREKERADATFASSKAYAREALDLAKSMTDSREYPLAVLRAHMAAGLLAWRDGDREEAVHHLLEASKIPAPEDVPNGPWSMLEYRLVNYLLKYGERESIIEYLERSAKVRDPRTRTEMLKEATAIREGNMPERYQRLLASGSL